LLRPKLLQCAAAALQFGALCLPHVSWRVSAFVNCQALLYYVADRLFDAAVLVIGIGVSGTA